MIPTHLTNGGVTYDEEILCRTCRIRSMIATTPQDPELPSLISLEERYHAYWQLIRGSVNRRVLGDERRWPTIEQELTDGGRQLLYGDPSGWYSYLVRRWIRRLANQGITVEEQYSNGIFDTAQRELMRIEREMPINEPLGHLPRPYLSDWEGVTYLTVNRTRTTLPRVEAFVSSLAIIDPSTIPAEDRRCAICLEPYPSADTTEPSSGEDIARLPCAGRHTFGLDCLRELYLSNTDGFVSCPLYREKFLTALVDDDSDESI